MKMDIIWKLIQSLDDSSEDEDPLPSFFCTGFLSVFFSSEFDPDDESSDDEESSESSYLRNSMNLLLFSKNFVLFSIPMISNS
jgi:hypothetical protein